MSRPHREKWGLDTGLAASKATFNQSLSHLPQITRNADGLGPLSVPVPLATGTLVLSVHFPPLGWKLMGWSVI